MREIKFRGYQEGLEEFVHGSYLFSPKFVDRVLYEHWIVRDDGFKMQINNPETIGQYTGINDKNGKEIYEGDVIVMKDDPEDIGSVAWDSHDMEWVISAATIEYKMGCYWSYELEVIGNIYENSELLDGANQ